MKIFHTILLIIFLVFGFIVGSVFESVFFRDGEGLLLWQNSDSPENQTEEIVFTDRDYVLPIEDSLEPVKKDSYADINITAKAVFVIDEKSGNILYEKNSEKKLAVASLTKLTTAVTLLELMDGSSEAEQSAVKYDLSKGVNISKVAVDAEGDSGALVMGERIKASDLFTIMLVASSNDAAVALAEDAAIAEGYSGGVRDFVAMMNEVAKKEGMENTHFSNPTGIDQKNHYSTARDVVKIAQIFLRRYPQFFAVTKMKSADIKSEDGKIEHRIKSTNELLGEIPEIDGGKTGYTREAGESLLLVVKNPMNNYRVIAVVIGANDRFSEMKKLVSWVWDNYEWK